MRNAASMLELIVAIVIMGIAMITLPLMLSRIESNNAFAVQQEAILMARTQMGDIMTYPWDENSTDATFTVGVLDTTAGDSNLSRIDANSTRRIGHVPGNERRKFFSVPRFASTTLTREGADYNDIDDFNDNITHSLVNSTDTNATLGYKLSDSNISISVKYISDTTDYTKQVITFDFNQTSNPGGTTNIKMVQLNLQNSLLDNNLTLRAFACNIGQNTLLPPRSY